MHRVVRFLLTLLAIFALVISLGYFAFLQFSQRWFDKDLRLRAALAVTAAREQLAQGWSRDPRGLTATLSHLTTDERLQAAAACDQRGHALAVTPAFPPQLSCGSVMAQMTLERGAHQPYWSTTTDLSSGPAHVSAVAFSVDGNRLGHVLLVQDLSYLRTRYATTRNVLIGVFVLIALGTCVVGWLLAKRSRRDWSFDLQRALRAQDSGEFRPLVRDVRSLVERLTRERVSESRMGAWTPERLRATLRQHLQGERIVILANREPYIHQRGEDGSIQVVRPASGMVTALEPVMRACSGVWIAHGGGNADRETADEKGHVAVPPGNASYILRRVWLSDDEEKGYYYGLANEGLWPLCHVAHTRPIFRADDWDYYVRINRRFADAVCEEVDSDVPIVLVQDYHFALAPSMIRAQLPRATILTFWHIPWPSAERIGICPWREEVLEGLLGSSIVGFHTQQYCNNFIESVDTFLECRVDREAQAIVHGKRKTAIRAYPISIEWPVTWLDSVASVTECRKSVRAELGLPDDALLGVGVDRLDYTKGIEERLQAVDELLTHHPDLRGRFTFVQLAAPSRTKITRYQELHDQVEKVADAINTKWGNDSYKPIILRRIHHQPPSVFRYYRAADLCYVSSLHDGMNLVAKEFVAARDDLQGVLILSQFTGAARELTEALVINPYDLRQAAEAMAFALNMSPLEQRERMSSMRRVVAELNVYRWAGRMLVDAADTRRREQMSGRFAVLRNVHRPVQA